MNFNPLGGEREGRRVDLKVYKQLLGQHESVPQRELAKTSTLLLRRNVINLSLEVVAF